MRGLRRLRACVVIDYVEAVVVDEGIQHRFEGLPVWRRRERQPVGSPIRIVFARRRCMAVTNSIGLKSIDTRWSRLFGLGNRSTLDVHPPAAIALEGGQARRHS